MSRGGLFIANDPGLLVRTAQRSAASASCSQRMLSVCAPLRERHATALLAVLSVHCKHSTQIAPAYAALLLGEHAVHVPVRFPARSLVLAFALAAFFNVCTRS